ncbi:MAG: hypothetical protein ASARMPREDX12_009407 [Alectoria sarmentosa]|nr:MAG: hypothetical protein ASARMPREDX12_009407 [Alectoria sarmentosa]
MSDTTEKDDNAIEQSVDRKPLLQEDYDGENQRRQPQRPSRWTRITSCANLIVLLLNLGIVSYLALQPCIYTIQREVFKTDVSPPSPAADIIEHHIAQLSDSSIFAGGPGEKADAAWEEMLKSIPDFSINRSEFETLNPSPETGAKLSNGRFLATLQVQHQLDCLDLLRKSLSPSSYPSEPCFQAPKPAIEGMQAHCVDYLRQALKCHGDVSILTYNWLQGQEKPLPYFKTLASCQKWDHVLEWAEGANAEVEDLLPGSKMGGQEELSRPL